MITSAYAVGSVFMSNTGVSWLNTQVNQAVIWYVGYHRLVGWLQFNVPFQHMYGYVKDEVTTEDSRFFR